MIEGPFPMALAPDDGTHILIERVGQRYAEDHFHVASWDEEEDWWVIHDGKDDHPLRGDAPSRWYRLPIE